MSNIEEAINYNRKSEEDFGKIDFRSYKKMCISMDIAITKINGMNVGANESWNEYGFR